MTAADQLPSPRFAAGSHVLVLTNADQWLGPYTVAGIPRRGRSEPGSRHAGHVDWFYELSAGPEGCDPLARILANYLVGENCLRPYDPPAPEPFAVLLERLRSPQQVAA